MSEKVCVLGWSAEWENFSRAPQVETASGTLFWSVWTWNILWWIKRCGSFVNEAVTCSRTEKSNFHGDGLRIKLLDPAGCVCVWEAEAFVFRGEFLFHAHHFGSFVVVDYLSDLVCLLSAHSSSGSITLSVLPLFCPHSISLLTSVLHEYSICSLFFFSLSISSPPPSLPPSRGAFGYCSRTGSGALCGRCSGEPGRPARPWRSCAPPPSECPTRSNTPCTGAVAARWGPCRPRPSPRTWPATVREAPRSPTWGPTTTSARCGGSPEVAPWTWASRCVRSEWEAWRKRREEGGGRGGGGGRRRRWMVALAFSFSLLFCLFLSGGVLCLVVGQDLLWQTSALLQTRSRP